MGEVIFSYNDLQGHLKNSPTLKLSAIVGTHSFYYYISDNQGLKGMFRYWSFQEKSHGFSNPCAYLPDVFNKEKLLFAEFSRIQVAISDSPFVITRNENLMQFQPKDIMKRLMVVPAGAEVRVQQIGHTDLTCLYLVPQILAREIDLYFHSAKLVHLAPCLVSFALSAWGDAKSCLAYVDKDKLILCIIAKGRLLFANSYQWKSVNDILYYLLAVRQVLRLSPKDTPVQFCGPFANDSMLQKLQPYLGECRLVESEVTSMNPPAFRIADLLSLYQCV